MIRRCYLYAAAAVAVLALFTGETGAQATKTALTEVDAPIPCPAFARSAGGGWKVLEPVYLHLRGGLVSFIVGTDFRPGTTTYGFAMPVILDRECGDRPGVRAAQR